MQRYTADKAYLEVSSVIKTATSNLEKLTSFFGLFLPSVPVGKPIVYLFLIIPFYHVFSGSSLCLASFLCKDVYSGPLPVNSDLFCF